MDFFKKGQEMLSGENNNQQQNTNQQAPQDGAAPAAGGSEDYGDKGMHSPLLTSLSFLLISTSLEHKGTMMDSGLDIYEKRY